MRITSSRLSGFMASTFLWRVCQACPERVRRGFGIVIPPRHVEGAGRILTIDSTRADDPPETAPQLLFEEFRLTAAKSHWLLVWSEPDWMQAPPICTLVLD